MLASCLRMHVCGGLRVHAAEWAPGGNWRRRVGMRCAREERCGWGQCTCSASSATLRSVMSCCTATKETTAPSESRMGVMEICSGNGVLGTVLGRGLCLVVNAAGSRSWDATVVQRAAGRSGSCCGQLPAGSTTAQRSRNALPSQLLAV